MTISFGIYARPSSTAWADVRKGPPAEAVREHLGRLVAFHHHQYVLASGYQIK